jgi:hypothetical protein
MMFTRRAFLRTTVGCSAGLVLDSPTRGIAYADDLPIITPRLRAAAPVRVPADFVGLGYEMSSVATPGLLSEDNHRYVELIKGIGAAGVLRAGGIVADYTRYDANGTAKAERQDTVITRASLERFGAFLRKIGWSTIWSVNFAQGSVEDAVVEARAVADVLGDRLLALELGNEVENYARGERPFRKPPYNYETYRREYNEWRASILKAVPGVRFAAPDTASSIEWVERMAKDANGDVQLLTTHYYRGNQKYGTAEQLFEPDPKLKDALVRLRGASQQSGIPWRMCETNSFFGGGRAGVSDTLVGALWALDYMLLLAAYGCSGVNIETGVNQLGFISPYSPIQDDGKGTNTAGAPYYGMLAFAAVTADCPEMLAIDMDTKGVNVTAYVLGVGGKPRSAVVVNKDGARDAQFSIKELGMGDVYALRLLAPSAENKTGLTFGGSQVDPEGRWAARTKERIADGNVIVPRMSAVVMRSVD